MTKFEVKTTMHAPQLDLWKKGYLIGFNPFTQKPIICDEDGFVIASNEIRLPDGTELSKADYDKAADEIRKAGIAALSGIRKSMSTY